MFKGNIFPRAPAHIPVTWICELCQNTINKNQTSIRCNHTHKTHWRCNINTHTLNSYRKQHHQRSLKQQAVTKQNTHTHLQSTERHNIILPININGIQNKIEELKHHSHNLKYHTTPLYEQTGRGLVKDDITFTHFIDTQEHQLTQHRTSIGQGTYKYKNKHITIANPYRSARDTSEQIHIIQTHLTSLNDSKKNTETTLLPYITNNIPHITVSKTNTLQPPYCATPPQQASTETNLLNIQSLGMSKALNTVNIPLLTHSDHGRSAYVAVQQNNELKLGCHS